MDQKYYRSIDVELLQTQLTINNVETISSVDTRNGFSVHVSDKSTFFETINFLFLRVRYIS